MGTPILQLPDVRRGDTLPGAGLSLPARSLRMALNLAHGWVGPRPRERFVEEPRPSATERIGYSTDDGWLCFLHRCPPRPGAPGEPVILAHGLGLNRLSLDYGGEDDLVSILHEAGFDLYLLEHRAHASAFPPADASSFDADTIATHDLPAAIQRVLELSGHRRVGWVGHGLGGQLLYIHLALDPHAPLFAAACLGSAVRFASPESTARLAGLVCRLLPERLGLPARQVLRLLSPGASRGRAWGSDWTAGGISGPVLRGMMNHACEDLRGGLVRQVARWISSGVLCDRHDRLDYLEALRGHELPLLVLAGLEDATCPPEEALRVLDYMGEQDKRGEVIPGRCGHLDLVQGSTLRHSTGPLVRSWLCERRQLAW